MKIICAWELGSGGGHVQKLAAIAQGLEQQGHEVCMALKDITSIAGLVDQQTIPVFQAPHWTETEPGLNPAIQFSSVLFHVGYLQPDRIASLVQGWLTLLDVLQPEAIIAEHAPTLLLAARIRSIPVVITGTGFTLPPNVTPIPDLTPWKPTPKEHLTKLEAGALQTINEVLGRFGQQPLSALCQLFAAKGRFLATWPELDHYGKREDESYWGPVMTTKERPEACWPNGKGEKVFVYMHYGYGIFNNIVKQLADSGRPSLIIAPGAPELFIKQFNHSSLRISATPVSLSSVANQCNLALTHSPHGTVAELLRHGIAPIMIPFYIEQAVLAHRVAKQGLGLMTQKPGPKAPLNISKVLQTTEQSMAIHNNAKIFAERYSDFDYVSSVNRLVDAIGACLAD